MTTEPKWNASDWLVIIQATLCTGAAQRRALEVVLAKGLALAASPDNHRRLLDEALAATGLNIQGSSMTDTCPSDASFQDRVQPWMMECFGAEIAADRVERGDRLLEEVLELLQSGGYDPARVLALRDYVWARPVGEPSQEVGGVMVTLAAYCLAHGLDMHAAGETELARISVPEIVAKIRAKQAAKPTGSALPQAVPQSEVAEQFHPTDADITTELLRASSSSRPIDGARVYVLYEDDAINMVRYLLGKVE